MYECRKGLALQKITKTNAPLLKGIWYSPLLIVEGWRQETEFFSNEEKMTKFFWPKWNLNLGPLACEAEALTTTPRKH